uniref:Transposase n=1 Tax=Angiostrongylus cantonensis TaxID=6313 RepID=A0A0K0D3Z7_ANGCA
LHYYINWELRNNAEMINHILKHYGTLNQLGDVGR